MTNDTTPAPIGAPVPRYKIGYRSDEWGERSSTPGGIPDPAGAWVRYDDHAAALASAAQPADVDADRAMRVQAAPAAVAGPKEAVAYLDIGEGGYLDLGSDLSDEALRKLPKGRHMLAIVGTYGVDGYVPVAAPTAQPSPAAQGDALNNTVRVPLDSLHADAAYLIGRLQLDTMDGARVVEIIRERIQAAKAALAAQAQEAAPAAQGDALPREDFAWMVVKEACETEPADEDDPECIRILCIDLKNAVLAAFLQLDAARTQAKGS